MGRPDDKSLLTQGVKIVQDILETAKLFLKGKLPDLLEDATPNWKDPNNRTIFLDRYAHMLAKIQLIKAFGEEIIICGEEESKKSNVVDSNKVVAFIDPIDGTDLLVRNFFNWCSAIAFALPKEKRIIGTVVGHSSGDIYFADQDGAYVLGRRAKRKKRIHRDSSEAKEFCHSSICYYGQKPKSFLTVAQHPGFLERMGVLKERMAAKEISAGKKIKGESLDVRIYNFGGNPMMVRIPSGAVDAVFSISGAAIHDVIPGAYIAVQAGAVFTDLNGNIIDPADTIQTPEQNIKYILSGSRSLAEEMKHLLSTTK